MLILGSNNNLVNRPIGSTPTGNTGAGAEPFPFCEPKRRLDIQYRPTSAMSDKQKAALERLWARLLTKKIPETAGAGAKCS